MLVTEIHVSMETLYNTCYSFCKKEKYDPMQ